MPGMPYHFEKGHWFDLFESYLNGPFDQLLGGLEFLRSGVPMRGSEFLSLPALQHDPAFGEDPPKHVAVDWFGRYERSEPGADRDYLRGTDGFDEQLLAMLGDRADGEVREVLGRNYQNDSARLQALGRASVAAGLDQPFPSTGFWHNYYGDVESICRATLRLAIETALDIGPDDPVETADPSHRLPIEMLWKCPQRWFEGWVIWRDVESTGGVVTLIFATPGSGSQVISSPSGPEEARMAPDSAGRAPTERAVVSSAPPLVRRRSPRGMRVVSHGSHVLMPPINCTRPMAMGQWAIPDFGPTYVGVGEITIAAPGKDDGGVDADEVGPVTFGHVGTANPATTVSTGGSPAAATTVGKD